MLGGSNATVIRNTKALAFVTGGVHPRYVRYKRYNVTSVTKKKHPTLKKGSDVFVGGHFERKQNDKAYFVTSPTVVVKEKEGLLGV